MSSAITIENSYKSTGADMGQNHLEVHKGEGTYLQPDEDKIITLSDNKLDDDSIDLAKKKAVQMGVRNEADWEKYNSKLQKSRRKANYDDYLATMAKNSVRQLEKHLKDDSMPQSKRSRIAEQLAAIHKNGGIPIDGSLFYLGSVEDYEGKSPEQLKKYRAFEIATLKRFYESDFFKTMHPGNFRAEIHLDELGRIHLQTQDVWYKKTGKRVSYAKRAMIRKILTDKFGEEGLNGRVCFLSACHNGDDVIFGPDGRQQRVDFRYRRREKETDGFHAYEHSIYPDAEKNARIAEVWRIEQMDYLEDIALETAKEYGVSWKRDIFYRTDGQHLTKPQYHIKMQQKLEAIRLKHASENAKKQQDSLEKQQEDLQQKHDDLNNHVAKTYKQATGKELDLEHQSTDSAMIEVKHAVDKKQSDISRLENTYARRKAEQDAQLEQERQTRLNQINIEIEQEKQRKLKKLQKWEQDLKQDENDYKARKTVLDRTMEMLPSIEGYYKTGEFVVNSPDKKTFARMMKTDIFRAIQKARKYDAQQTYVERLEAAFKKLFKRVYHKVLTDVKMGIKTVLEPPKAVEKKPAPAENDNQYKLSTTKSIVQKKVFEDTPSAEAYEKEAQSTYIGGTSLEKKRSTDPDRND